VRIILKGKALLAYTAGIIDGEGCICISRKAENRYKKGYSLFLQVTATNTKEWLGQWLKMQFGGFIFADTGRGNRQVCWRWCVIGNDAIAFLEKVLPYLQLKKSQAELAIAFQKNRKRTKNLSEGDNAVQEAQRIMMMSLNKRGKGV